MKSCQLTVFFTPHGFVVEKTISSTKNVFFDQSLLSAFDADRDQALYTFGFSPRDNEMSPSLIFLHQLSEAFVHSLSTDSGIEMTRRARPLENPLAQDLLLRLPYAPGMEHVDPSWLNNRWEALSAIFEQEIVAYPGSVQDYLHSKNSDIQMVGRVYFHLVENRDAACPFAFLATYTTGTREQVNHLPLKNALLEYKGMQDQLVALLTTVSRTCDQSDFISELTESGELFSPLQFTADEAYLFLREVPLYEDCGVICRIPDWWRKKGGIRLSVTVGEKPPAALGMETLMSFTPEIYAGEVPLTKEEVEALLNQASGLSFLKGKWVEVDHEKLRAALEAFEKVQSDDSMTFAQAMRLQLNANESLAVDATLPVEMSQGEWLKTVRNRMLHPADLETLHAGQDFKAALRHYQQAGLNWLGLMKKLGFGALLADDMGLGKTIQVLALLEHLRQHSDAKTLLVIPASLLFNWQKEADHFAPHLRYQVLHATNKNPELESADLFITTYGMVTRIEALSDIDWDLIILDEAQAIKNPGTKQTKAVKALKGTTKVALTGTPIENRLSDLWSIFDFLNQGLLGSAKEFTRFTKALKEQPEGYARLRELVSPFILRRLKTDKKVITDLPDKIELKAYTHLTRKQVTLYNALLAEMQQALETASGISRKGMVLSAIMKFKQICNHPDHYMGQRQFDHSHSGKFQKMGEICEVIAEKRERVLVFTQFKEMTEPISAYLETVFQKPGLVLHGGTGVKKRGTLVEAFNGEEYVPYMVLSLKAGGVGLNLTSASHVIHFDRWWNPAVENQATDRAFRIGQQNNVMVHKFVTTGTLEEKIDAMLTEKEKMAAEIVAKSGENWITEMTNDELIQLVRLEV